MHVRGVTLLLVASALLFSGCLQRAERFETLEQARGAGFFERGWLPDVLPPGSGPIDAVHDLDTNARCSRSTFPANELDTLETRLSLLGFKPFDGVVVKLPLKACPFSRRVARGAKLFQRDAGEQLEFVGIDLPSDLLFWAAHPERLGLD